MRRILFASDFSKVSRKAFAAAVKMAKANRGELTIVHAFAPLMPVAPDQYVGPETWEQIDVRERRWARHQLAALVQKAKKAGVRAVGLVLNGNPTEQIVRTARTNHADLLVIGTHGRTGWAKFFLGSVANGVVATAPCPVLTVRGK
jgi:nucleotide-binding universal stress UspA family protein